MACPAHQKCYHLGVSRLADSLALFLPVRGRGATQPSYLRPAVLPALCLLLADLLLPQQETYANPEYGFSLIAAVGAAGCISYLLSAVSRLQQAPFGARALLFGPSSIAPSSTNSRGDGEDWPLLVALLFGSLLILFSGLGGWVEALLRVTGPAA
jgi:hypothetical protein